MRALLPDVEGFVERDGVKVGYEVFGSGAPTILLMPTWAIVHSRLGRGRSPTWPGTSGSSPSTRVATVAATGRPRQRRTPPVRSPRTLLLSSMPPGPTPPWLSRSRLVRGPLLGFAARHPDRVLGAVFVAAALGLDDPPTDRPNYSFTDELDTDEGWARYNQNYWRRNWPGFLDFFMATVNSEPHSTKQIEDCVGWGSETTPEAMILTMMAPGLEPDWPREDETRPLAYDFTDRISCPCLVRPWHARTRSSVSSGASASRPPWVVSSWCSKGPGTCCRRASRCVSTCRSTTSSTRCSHLRRSPEPGPGQRHADLERSTCRRRSGWATRCAMSRSPASCARSGPSSRSTGWPSTR